MMSMTNYMQLDRPSNQFATANYYHSITVSAITVNLNGLQSKKKTKSKELELNSELHSCMESIQQNNSLTNFINNY